MCDVGCDTKMTCQETSRTLNVRLSNYSFVNAQGGGRDRYSQAHVRVVPLVIAKLIVS